MCLTETYSRVLVGKIRLTGCLLGIDGNKEFYCHCNIVLENAIRRVQVNQDGLKLYSTHQLLLYAEDVNILGGSVHTIKKIQKLW